VNDGANSPVPLLLLHLLSAAPTPSFYFFCFCNTRLFLFASNLMADLFFLAAHLLLEAVAFN
jgi:hypothetical protein